MTFAELVSGILPAEDLPGGEVSLVAQDSRRVVPGAVFVCMEGRQSDGHTYARQAQRAGAALIVTQRPLGLTNEITVPETRAVYGALCQRFFGEPAKKLQIAAVTGTNGKTTIASVLKQVLEHSGLKCGLIGTVQSEIGDMAIPARFTTPEAWDLAALMARMVSAGCTHLVMEASSQALEQGRLAGIRFALGIFTNLTRDHLDYHGDMEQYFAAKKLLFANCRSALVNCDDEWGLRLVADLTPESPQTEKSKPPAPSKTVKTYSIANAAADFSAHSVELKAGGVRFGFLGGDMLYPVFFRMPGEYSVSNALAAGGAAMMLGLSGEQAAEGLSAMKGVLGRCEIIYEGDYTVLRDFAHTGDGVRKLLAALRPFVPKRLVVLYGCAGERDAAKRPDMSAAAAEYGDIIYLTADNPRLEPAEKTIADALAPLESSGKEYHTIVDRKSAIQAALERLSAGDMLALCCKGHEDYQVMDGYTIYFNERQIVEEWLQEHTAG